MDEVGATLRGKRILICEDEGLIQLQWKKLLDYHGAAVVGFTPSGSECVEIAIRERPDIVLMDVGLKDSDGWESSRRILRLWENTCIVMISAQSHEEALENMANIPVKGFIQKPIAGDEFIRELVRCYAASN